MRTLLHLHISKPLSKIIYPIELKIQDTTDTERYASYLYLYLEIDSEGWLRTKERISIFPLGTFHLYVETFHLHMEYISLSWYDILDRACGSYQDFLDRGLLLIRKLLNQWFLLVKRLIQERGIHITLVICKFIYRDLLSKKWYFLILLLPLG
jgi:hypothetical protein